jgi:hypothetical protein
MAMMTVTIAALRRSPRRLHPPPPLLIGWAVPNQRPLANEVLPPMLLIGCVMLSWRPLANETPPPRSPPLLIGRGMLTWRPLANEAPPPLQLIGLDAPS